MTGQYLGHHARVLYAVATPADSLFFRENGIRALETFREATKFSCPGSCNKQNLLKYLEETGTYMTAGTQERKDEIAEIFISCSMFFQHVFRKYSIERCVVHERNFLDTAAAQHASELCGIRTFYLSSGFFRGKTVTIAPERIRFTDVDTWQKRIAEFNPENIVKAPCPPCDLDFSRETVTDIKKAPAWKTAASRLSATLLSPAAARLSGMLRPGKGLRRAAISRIRKQRARALKPDRVTLPPRFVLLPLQGNEILSEVPNPLDIKNMEHLTGIVANAIDKMNSRHGLDHRLVVKEHPLRPFVIGTSFTRRFPDVILLRKFDMNRLFESASAVVTFNSLAGFEALQANIPVVMLGPLFYGIKGLVHRPSCTADLAETIYRALNSSTDQALLHRLISYLKTRYEVEADRKNLDAEGLYNIACRICT